MMTQKTTEDSSEPAFHYVANWTELDEHSSRFEQQRHGIVGSRLLPDPSGRTLVGVEVWETSASLGKDIVTYAKIAGFFRNNHFRRALASRPPIMCPRGVILLLKAGATLAYVGYPAVLCVDSAALFRGRSFEIIRH